jgi:hypothetical protein
MANTACQAVVYEIRLPFFSLLGNQGSEIDWTYPRTCGTFDASILLRMLFCSFRGMSVHFVFEFTQVPHNFPSKDDQSEDEVSFLHFLIFKLWLELVPSWQSNEPLGHQFSRCLSDLLPGLRKMKTTI